MEKRLSLLLAVAGSALLISGCYTQVGTVRDEPSREYSASEQEVGNESPPADSGYSENGGYGDNNGDYDRYRERFYYDYYYPPFGAPWAFGAGVLMGGYYSPFFWNPWDPWYPGGGWYYPHSAYPYYGGRYRQPFAYYNGVGGRYGQTRNFGVTRGGSGSVRGMSGGASYGASPTVRGVILPAGGSSRGTSRSPATTATTRSTTGHNTGRRGAVDRTRNGRTGGSRATGRYSTPPPPPRSSGGGSRGTSGGAHYSPPSPPPASTGSTGRSSGGRGSSSGGSGGSRGGSRR